jgi:transposase InsO family protein
MKIQEIYDDSNQIFGAGKITAVLRNNDYHVSQAMVLELMRDMGLVSIRQTAKSQFIKDSKKFKNYLNQEFHTDKPNQVWVSDVTYFRYNEKSYCICIIIDLFSRKVVGYRVGSVNSTQLVKSTFKQAHESRHPDKKLVFHTDRGSNYRSKTFCDYLKSRQVKQSFSRACVPYDNSVAESFFSSMKREELYRTKYRSESEFRKAIDNYMEFYNAKRPHQKLKYKTPEQAESDFYLKQKVAK